MKERLNPVLEHVYEKGPETGSVLEVRKGVYWLRIPIPFELNHINVWLIEEEDSFTLVDTGIASEQTKQLWQELLGNALKGKSLKRIIVTHFHPDHFGLANWLSEQTGAAYLASRETEERTKFVLLEAEKQDKERIDNYYHQHGIEEITLFEEFLKGKYYSQVVSGHKACTAYLENGEKITIGDNEWQVIMGYGHAPGHITLYCPALGCLISGDQVLPTISTNIAVHADNPDADPLSEFLASFNQFESLPADVIILPSHGLPFRGLKTRLDELSRHHQETLEKTLEFCREPHSAGQLMPKLFNRKLEGLNMVLAFGETLAHLNYLYKEGRLNRGLESGVLVYSRGD